jgi:hypothetical protein
MPEAGERQVKHPATRELYQYWNQRRGSRALPDRSDIEPGHLKTLLPDTFLLTIDADGGHPFRIAGTRLCALFGRELKGRSFVGLWDDGGPMLDLLATLINDRTGLCAGAYARVDGLRADLELVLLPLTQGGGRPERFIGALAPFERPYWFGNHPVARLRLGMHRHVGAPFQHVGQRLISGAQADRLELRKGLQVVEGGRA